LRRNRALSSEAIYSGIDIILITIDITNDVLTKAIIRTYTDFYSAPDRDEVYPDESNLIAGF